MRDRDGRVVRRMKPSEQSEVMKPSTASALAPMMSKVVEEGTGTAAALEGIDVAGKTGTAEVGADEPGLVHRLRAGAESRAWRSR